MVYQSNRQVHKIYARIYMEIFTLSQLITNNACGQISILIFYEFYVVMQKDSGVTHSDVILGSLTIR